MSLAAALRLTADAIKQIHVTPPTPPPKNLESTVFFSRGGRGMMLSDDTARAYSSALDAVCRAVRKKELLSRVSVESALQAAILKAGEGTDAIHQPQQFQAQLNAAITELSNKLTAPPKQWEVHIPARN